MPDLRPITESFPWFAIRNRPVFNGINVRSNNGFLTDSAGHYLTDDHGNRLVVCQGPLRFAYLTDDFGNFLTDDAGNRLVVDICITQGDLYRYA